jgi:hypothetical protein
MVQFQDFSLFKKAHSEFAERTISGAVVTVVMLVGTAFVFLFQIFLYMTPNETSTMMIQQHVHDTMKIKLSLDIQIPCPLLKVNVVDYAGTHQIDTVRRLKKIALNEFGNEVKGAVAEEDSHTLKRLLSLDQLTPKEVTSEIGDIKKMMDTYSGCRIDGHLVVSKVPGRVEIGANFGHKKYGELFTKETGLVFNTTHVIRTFNFLNMTASEHHESPKPPSNIIMQALMSFFGLFKHFEVIAPIITPSITGPVSMLAKAVTGGVGIGGGKGSGKVPGLNNNMFEKVMGRWRRTTMDNPLDGSNQVQTATTAKSSYRYYLQVVPMRLANYAFTYKFTMSKSNFDLPPEGQELPTLAFDYTVSPISIQYKNEGMSIFTLLSNLLSMTGGVYALAILTDGLVDSIKALVKTSNGKVL